MSEYVKNIINYNFIIFHKMKQVLLIAAVLVASAVQGVKIEGPLTRAEEARAIENAVLSRTVGSLDSEVAHPKDADHSGAIAAMRGILGSNEDAIKKMGDLKKKDPILGKAVERINHPYFPYPKKSGI